MLGFVMILILVLIALTAVSLWRDLRDTKRIEQEIQRLKRKVRDEE